MVACPFELLLMQPLTCLVLDLQVLLAVLGVDLIVAFPMGLRVWY